MAIDSALYADKSHTIHALQKTPDISEMLLEADQRLRLGFCDRQIDRSKPTTFPILTALLQVGSLAHDDSGYWFGIHLLSLGHAVEVHLDVRLKMITSSICESEFILIDYPNGGM